MPQTVSWASFKGGGRGGGGGEGELGGIVNEGMRFHQRALCTIRYDTIHGNSINYKLIIINYLSI